EAGGTTIRSYNSEPGITGRFQLEVMVHGRENEPCKICGTPIKKIQYKGRGTYYCVRCQK
ncbi:MAG: DNA-formamidopyrimidine glycosylase, partial [Erysipelotrichales bacterium]|nr:DNA-formamidopyrimidine glycosylase [Erysipelotrichales bacterium]